MSTAEKWISIRVSLKEHDRIATKAKRARLTFTAYTRAAVLGDAVYDRELGEAFRRLSLHLERTYSADADTMEHLAGVFKMLDKQLE